MPEPRQQRRGQRPQRAVPHLAPGAQGAGKVPRYRPTAALSGQNTFNFNFKSPQEMLLY